MKKSEKTILWLFFTTLLISTLANILSYSLSIWATIGTIFWIITIILDIILIVLSIKEIRKNNKALGILVLVLSIIDILINALSFITGFIAGYTAV